MPEISRFFNIIIQMYYSEHGMPHFHAYYNEYKITVLIDNGTIKGEFPRKALQLVLEWYDEHKSELLDNWNRAKIDLPLLKIKPLE